MSDKKILLVILLAMILSFEFIDGYWPKKSKISTHTQTDNAGKWWHYFRAHIQLEECIALYHNSKVEDYSVRVVETFLDITNIDGMPKHYFHFSSSISAK